jgi:hypothetical protein
MLRSSAVRSVPLLSRFAPRAGLVTLRQTFVRRCHGDIGRPQNDGRKRSLPLHHSALSDCCERGRCVPAMFDVGVAPPHEEPRSGSSSSAHESTSGRSTNYGSGHLIRVFRDIGRIFSLLFLLSHPSPIGDPAEREGSKVETEYGFVEGKKWFQLCFVRNSPRWTSRQRVIRHHSSSCWQCLGTHEAIMRCRCGAPEVE